MENEKNFKFKFAIIQLNFHNILRFYIQNLYKMNFNKNILDRQIYREAAARF